MDPFLTGRKILCENFLFREQLRDVIPAQLICGSTCMENDRLAELLNCEELQSGDVVTCRFAGAYTMAFNSCFINLPPYVYRKEGDVLELVRDKNRDLLMQI